MKYLLHSDPHDFQKGSVEKLYMCVCVHIGPMSILLTFGAYSLRLPASAALGLWRSKGQGCSGTTWLPESEVARKSMLFKFCLKGSTNLSSFGKKLDA